MAQTLDPWNSMLPPTNKDEFLLPDEFLADLPSLPSFPMPGQLDQDMADEPVLPPLPGSQQQRHPQRQAGTLQAQQAQQGANFGFQSDLFPTSPQSGNDSSHSGSYPPGPAVGASASQFGVGGAAWHHPDQQGSWGRQLSGLGDRAFSWDVPIGADGLPAINNSNNFDGPVTTGNQLTQLAADTAKSYEQSLQGRRAPLSPNDVIVPPRAAAQPARTKPVLRLTPKADPATPAAVPAASAARARATRGAAPAAPAAPELATSTDDSMPAIPEPPTRRSARSNARSTPAAAPKAAPAAARSRAAKAAAEAPAHSDEEFLEDSDSDFEEQRAPKRSRNRRETKEERENRRLELNRRAQQRFRIRQKAKMAEAEVNANRIADYEARMAALTEELNALRLEKGLVEARAARMARQLEQAEVEGGRALAAPPSQEGQARALAYITRGQVSPACVAELAAGEAAWVREAPYLDSRAVTLKMLSLTDPSEWDAHELPRGGGGRAVVSRAAAGQHASTNPSITLTVHNNQEFRLSLEEMKSLPPCAYMELYKQYVARLTEELARAAGNPASKAGRRVERLWRELRVVSLPMAVADPKLLRMALLLNTETFSHDPADQSPELWQRVADALHLVPAQRRELAAARRDYYARLSQLQAERRRLLGVLSGTLGVPASGEHEAAGPAFAAGVAAQSALHANMAGDHDNLLQYLTTVSVRVLTPFQNAVAVTSAHPYMLNVPAIVEVVAEADGEPSAAALMAQTSELRILAAGEDDKAAQ